MGMVNHLLTPLPVLKTDPARFGKRVLLLPGRQQPERRHHDRIKLIISARHHIRQKNFF